MARCALTLCAVALVLSTVACGRDPKSADPSKAAGLTAGDLRQALGPPDPPGFGEAQGEVNRLIDEGEPAKAVEIMEKFLQSAPDYFGAHFMLGRAHAAVADLDTVRTEDPRARARHLEAAVTHYQRYIDLYQQAEPLDRALALERMIRINRAGGLNRPVAADALSRRLIDEMPLRADPYRLRAEVLREQGRHDEVTVLLLHACKVVQPEQRDVLAGALQQQVKESPQLSIAEVRALLDEAMAIVDDVVTRDPQQSHGLLLRSLVLEQRAERLERDPSRRRALHAEADRLFKAFEDAQRLSTKMLLDQSRQGSNTPIR